MTELSYDKLKNMSIEDIYKYFQKEYAYIYKSYNYIFKTYSEFLIVIKNILNDININLPNKPSFNYKNYLLNQSKIKLNKYVKSRLDEEDKFTVISSYININLNTTKNELNELKKLIRWFQEIDYIPDPSVIIELVTNNEKIKTIVANIVENNLEKIKKYGLDGVFSEELVFEFLDIYCNMNNIIDSNAITANDFYIEDREKLKGTYLGADAIINELKAQKLYVLSKEEERDLFIKLKNGDEDAYNKILYHNLRLVLKVARRYCNFGLEFADLIQEGNIGLLKAIERYDVNKGFKFSTYAMWWIRQAISRAIGNYSKNIRVPIHKMEKLNKFREQVKELKDKLGYDPSYMEIAKYLKIKYSEVEENFELLQNPTSLNTKLGEDEDVELGDLIPHPATSNLEDDIISDNLIQEIDNLLVKAGLTNIERDILKYRYGLNYSEEKILEEIGKIYGVSRERIRQIEAKAIIKLRKYPLTKQFASYLDNPERAEVRLEKLRTWHYDHPKSCTVYNLDVTNIEKEERKDKKTKRKLKTIYEAIPNYPKEEIDKVIAQLPDEDRKIFYLRNSDAINNLNSQELKSLNYFYNLVVEKIKRYLRSPKKIKTIYECLNKYTKEEVDKGISLLSDEDKKIIYYRYGEDLEHPRPTQLWDPVKYRGLLYVTIFTRIKRNIDRKQTVKIKQERKKKTMPKKLMSIYEQLDKYTKEEIDSEIAKLKDEDKRIFYLRNGDDLEHPKSSLEFTDNMKTRYYNIVTLMRTHLASPSKYIRGTIFYQLNNINPNYTKEDFLKAISMLSIEEKAIITSRYGDDLDKPISPKTKKVNYREINKILKHIIDILANRVLDNQEADEEKFNELREFYIRAIELLKSPIFMKLLINLSVKDAIILAIIILSYLENKEINLEDLANLLEIDIVTFKKDYKKMLLLFRDNINEYLNTHLNNDVSLKK